MVPIRKLLMKDNTHVISILMFYENRNIMIFEMLGSVFYCIMYNHLCVDCMCLHQDKFSLENEVF